MQAEHVKQATTKELLDAYKNAVRAFPELAEFQDVPFAEVVLDPEACHIVTVPRVEQDPVLVRGELVVTVNFLRTDSGTSWTTTSSMLVEDYRRLAVSRPAPR